MNARLSLVSLLLALQTGCASKPVPPDRYYRLDTASAAAPAPLANAPQVLMEPFKAYGIYGERPLVFRRPEARGAVEQYRQQFWVELPALMLSDGLRTTLRRVLGSDRVHGLDTRVLVDFVVVPRVRRLDQVIEGAGARAEFAAEFLVTDEDHQTRFVLMFDDSLPLADTHPQAFADAVSQLAARANTELVLRLTQEFSR